MGLLRTMIVWSVWSCLAWGVDPFHPCAASLVGPTPHLGPGPYFPGLERFEGRGNDLLGGRGASFPFFVLEGTVRDTVGQPVAGAAVHLWQADPRGRYEFPGIRVRSRFPKFQYFGITTTDAQGRYRFRTLQPPPYQAQGAQRSAHLHLRVENPGKAPLFTEVHFYGDQSIVEDWYLITRSRGFFNHLVMTFRSIPYTWDASEEEAETRVGTFDIVLP